MTYEYLEHGGEEGIKVIADTLEKAFIEGAKALFNLMIVNLEDVEPKHKINIKCKADSIENLYVNWLNELIYEKDVNLMFFSKFKVDIKKQNNIYLLNAEVYGEEFNADKHFTEVEVKAVTFQGLKYEFKNGKHILIVVVDV